MISSSFQIFSPRWGHEDAYSVRLTKSSFEVSLNTKHAKCEFDPCGEVVWTGHAEGVENPMLNIMSDDFIYPPTVVPEAIEWLLREYRDGKISDDDAKVALSDLFSWIDETARAKPTGVWTSYWG
ncbi:hypothetical protein [Novipirellula caenicola]|uniref:hypothetical protein n=1 Tax=Novipirellula caenicola TaxID=1536901 RepID=UPI0031E6E7C4